MFHQIGIGLDNLKHRNEFIHFRNYNQEIKDAHPSRPCWEAFHFGPARQKYRTTQMSGEFLHFERFQLVSIDATK
jgi:hypothetical protein